MNKFVLVFLLLSFQVLPKIPQHKTNEGQFFIAEQSMASYFFSVPLNKINIAVGDELDIMGLKPLVFNNLQGKGVVILKPWTYMAKFENSYRPNAEIEFNLLVVPKSFNLSAQVKFIDYLNGSLNSSKIGQFRFDVVADDIVAVSAGRGIQKEHKYLGNFDYKVTALNNLYNPHFSLNFNMSAYVWSPNKSKDSLIFKLESNTSSLIFKSLKFKKGELLFSSNPAEFSLSMNEAIEVNSRYRIFADGHLEYAEVSAEMNNIVKLKIGYPRVGIPLKPLSWFGEKSMPIKGSEFWPLKFANRLRIVMKKASLIGVWETRPRPAGFEEVPITFLRN